LAQLRWHKALSGRWLPARILSKSFLNPETAGLFPSGLRLAIPLGMVTSKQLVRDGAVGFLVGILVTAITFVVASGVGP
jgi:hypothetical protein